MTQAVPKADTPAAVHRMRPPQNSEVSTTPIARGDTVYIEPEADVLPADVLLPEYYVHIARRFQRGMRIEFLWQDNSKHMDVVVLDVGDKWVKVVALSFHLLAVPRAATLKADKSSGYLAVPTAEAPPPPVAPAPTLPEDAPVYVKHVNIAKKWTVIRKSDQEHLQSGFTDRAPAIAFALDYIEKTKE